jgi:RNA polymerase sigma-70 factor (ECF subfamily)
MLALHHFSVVVIRYNPDSYFFPQLSIFPSSLQTPSTLFQRTFRWHIIFQYFYVQALLVQLSTKLPYEEGELLLRIAEGDEQAFGQLFEQYRSPFYHTCLQLTGSRDVSEEVVQETFIRIWEKRDHLRDLQYPKGYLYKIFQNVLFSYFRYVANQRKVQGSFIQYYEQQGSDEGLHHKLRQEAQLALIEESLQHLTPAQLKVFRLIRQEGLSRKEAAAQLGISPNTVRNLLAEGMRVLKQHHPGIHPVVLLSVLFMK